MALLLYFCCFIGFSTMLLAINIGYLIFVFGYYAAIHVQYANLSAMDRKYLTSSPKKTH